MPSFKTNRIVPYTPLQMFDLVADVERYPEFLPLCEGLRINSREQRGGTTHLTATMDVGYGALKESFATKVDLMPAEQRIDVAYMDGPFSHLESQWEFKDHDIGSEIRFLIDYEFRSPVLALLMGAVFDKAFKKFAQNFEDRARTIYGKLDEQT